MLHFLKRVFSMEFEAEYYPEPVIPSEAVKALELRESPTLAEKRKKAIAYLRERHRYVLEDKSAIYTPATTPIDFGGNRDATKVCS